MPLVLLTKSPSQLVHTPSHKSLMQMGAPLLKECANPPPSVPSTKECTLTQVWASSSMEDSPPSYGALSSLNGQTLMQVRPYLLKKCALALLLFSSSHKWRMSLINALYPPLASFGQALKDQWPRSNLSKSNQWVRSNPKISLRKSTFLSCFMSINSPTLWNNCHFMT